MIGRGESDGSATETRSPKCCSLTLCLGCQSDSRIAYKVGAIVVLSCRNDTHLGHVASTVPRFLVYQVF
jgi:hypothetical protein